MTPIYKIVSAALWREAEAKGKFDGAPVDIADGYIHFSTAAQTVETAQKHFVRPVDEGLCLLIDDCARSAGSVHGDKAHGLMSALIIKERKGFAVRLPGKIANAPRI